MQFNRRRVLQSLAALTLLPGCSVEEPFDPGDSPATPGREPEPAAWVPGAAIDVAAFAWGVQIGDVRATEAVLGLRTLESVVEIVVVVGVSERWEEVQRFTAEVVDGHVRVDLEGLEADRVYRVVAFGTEGCSPVTRFRTALGDDGFRKIRFGATSCLGNYNPGMENLAYAAEHDLDFMLFLGDTVYADGAYTLAQYRAKYDRAFKRPSLQALLSNTSVVATWDDHEVDNNWVEGETVTNPQVLNALQAFGEAMPRLDSPTVWRKLSWGTVLDIIVLDTRSERGRGDRIVSEEQLDWAIDAIRNSEATFKLVLTSVHLADHTDLWGSIQQQDRWQGYPEQREALVAALAQTPGVLVITGDMHYGAVHSLARPGDLGDAVWEVAAGPAGSSVNVFAGMVTEDYEQYPVLLADWSVCLFEADPGTGQISVDFVGNDGDVLATIQLQP